MHGAGKVPNPRAVARSLAFSEAFRGIVNEGMVTLAGRKDASSGTEDSTAALALPMDVHTKIVLGCVRIVNKVLHDKCKTQAPKIAGTALELALMLRTEAERAARDSSCPAFVHDAAGYLGLMLNSPGLGPASTTSCVPERVRYVLGAGLVKKIGSRAGGHTDAELSEVRGDVAAIC